MTDRTAHTAPMPVDAPPWAQEILNELRMLQEAVAKIDTHIVETAAEDRSAPLNSVQAARRLNVSRRKLDELVAGGHLRPLRIGRKRLFPQEQLDSFLRLCER